jgi:hypothetical protein
MPPGHRLRHHGHVTDDTPQQDPLPPDPALYDEYRNVAARKRGLEQPYIAGGDDPELEETLAKERPYVRLLIAMVVGLVMLGFVLGIIGTIITNAAR